MNSSHCPFLVISTLDNCWRVIRSQKWNSHQFNVSFVSSSGLIQCTRCNATAQLGILGISIEKSRGCLLVRMPGFLSWLHNLDLKSHWISHLTSKNLSFLSSKIRMINLFCLSQSCDNHIIDFKKFCESLMYYINKRYLFTFYLTFYQTIF